MVVHACVPHRGTAWEQAMDELGRYFEAAAASSDIARPGLGRAPRSHRVVRGCRDSKSARQTARLHHALATPAGDDEFAPVPLTRTDLDRLQAISAPTPSRRADWPSARTATITLGQLLVRDAGFTIVDFEGDAALSIADRRQRRSPLDDVAGMLRSFGRAADVGLATWTERHTEHADRLRLGPGLGGRRSGPVPAELSGVRRPGVVPGG